PGAVGGDQDAERRGGPHLPQGVGLPHRLLEHPPGRRQPRQQLDARPCGQDGPGPGGSVFLHGCASFALSLVCRVLPALKHGLSAAARLTSPPFLLYNEGHTPPTSTDREREPSL